MSKERFSHLQYYILSKLCQSKDGCIERGEVYEFFGDDRPSTRVVVSRSLRRLKERGFVNYNMRYKNPMIRFYEEK